MPVGIDDHIGTVLNYKMSDGFFGSAVAHGVKQVIERSACGALAGIELVTSAGKVLTSRRPVATPGGKTRGDAQMPCLAKAGVPLSFI